MSQLHPGYIKTLHDFLNRKQITYYDVQIELVDHFASAIEDSMNKDSNLSFSAALQKVYSEFGGFHGLQEFKKEKYRSLYSYWNKNLKEYFLGYLKSPKILITILLGIIFFYSYSFLNLSYFFGGVSILFLALLLLFKLSYRKLLQAYFIFDSLFNKLAIIIMMFYWGFVAMDLLLNGNGLIAIPFFIPSIIFSLGNVMLVLLLVYRFYHFPKIIKKNILREYPIHQISK